MTVEKFGMAKSLRQTTSQLAFRLAALHSDAYRLSKPFKDAEMVLETREKAYNFKLTETGLSVCNGTRSVVIPTSEMFPAGSSSLRATGGIIWDRIQDL